MRLMISLTREPGEPETPISIRNVAAASLSYVDRETGKTVVYASKTYGDEKSFWEGLAGILRRSDVVPCGWNMRYDIWPSVCANFVRLDIPCDRMQPASERWSKAMLLDLSVVVNQSAYSVSPSAVDAVQFLSGKRYDELDEAYRFEHIDDIESISEKEHAILNRLLARYVRLSNAKVG